MKKSRKKKVARPDLTAMAAAQETAHLSTDHIRSRAEVMLFEAHVIADDIERLTAALQGLRRRKAKLESAVAGMQATVGRR